jgi:hypothetical protein
MKKTVDKIPFYRLGWNKSFINLLDTDFINVKYKLIT